MYYPLTVRDFIDRAETVYPDRVAVVDEPDQPAPSLGTITYRELAELARAQAARLDQLGVPARHRAARVGSPARGRRPRSTTPRVRRRGPRACSSRTATCG